LAPCGRRPHTPSHPGAGPEPSGRRVRLVAGRDWLSTAFLQRLSLLHLLLLGLAFLSLPLLTLALGYGLRSWFCHRIGLRPVRSTNLAEIEARRTMPGLAQSTLCTRSSWFEGTVRIESRDLLDVSPWPTLCPVVARGAGDPDAQHTTTIFRASERPNCSWRIWQEIGVPKGTRPWGCGWVWTATRGSQPVLPAVRNQIPLMPNSGPEGSNPLGRTIVFLKKGDSPSISSFPLRLRWLVFALVFFSAEPDPSGSQVARQRRLIRLAGQWKCCAGLSSGLPARYRYLAILTSC
jgi:hypothetical protein